MLVKKVSNTPSGWFSWGFSVGVVYFSMMDSCFGDLKVIDNIDLFISISGMSIIALYLLVDLIREYGK